MTNYVTLHDKGQSWEFLKRGIKLIIAVIQKWLRASIYLFKVNNRNPRKRCEICSNLTQKTKEQLH